MDYSVAVVEVALAQRVAVVPRFKGGFYIFFVRLLGVKIDNFASREHYVADVEVLQADCVAHDFPCVRGDCFAVGVLGAQHNLHVYVFERRLSRDFLSGEL